MHAQMIISKRMKAEMYGEQSLMQNLRQEANFIDFYEDQISLYAERQNSSYRGALYHLKAFTQGKLRFKELDILWLEEFKQYLMKKVSRTSTGIYLDRLKIIWKAAIKQKIVQENPFLSIKKPPKDSKPAVFLTEAEIRQMLTHQEGINPEIVQAFIFSCHTGLRFSDLVKLNWQEVKTGYYQCKKTKKTEEIICSPTARQILEHQRQQKNGDTVFQLRNLNYYNRHLKKWAFKAGISKNITSHVGRHTCANLLNRMNVSTPDISKILGHASIQMTQNYLHILKTDKEQAVSKLPEFKIN